jgi:alpha-ketoglutarate-dependent taurine dioxygenase
VWHTDVTFMKRPPLGSILRAVTLPPTGGDTNWADSQLADDSLSEPVKDLVDRLTAVHDGNREFGYHLAQRRGGQGLEWDGEIVTRLDPVEHPVVRVHPETGRKGIFVNPGFTSHIAGVSDAESRAILDLLYAHLTKPEHIVRHRWRAGDLAMWDNRSTAHYANRDYGTARRVMHRITLRGDIPGRAPLSCAMSRPGRRARRARSVAQQRQQLGALPSDLRQVRRVGQHEVGDTEVLVFAQ